MPNLQSKATESTHLSVERAEHREWIGGRAITLLSHYWRDDDPVELTAAIGRDWADVLEGLPQEYIQRACISYQRREPRRKPTPGAIYELAQSCMPKPAQVSHADPEHFGPPRPRLTQEQRERVLRQAGVRVDENGRVVGL